MTARRAFADKDFDLLGEIDLERRTDGEILALMPQARLAKAGTSTLHAYGSGPFCRFKIGRNKDEPGLYVLTLDSDPVYVGECADVGKRWGPNGYGGISPRNCYVGGQQTNCRINAAILSAVKEGRRLGLWFHQLMGDKATRLSAEASLVHALRPTWNRTGPLLGKTPL